MLTSIDTQKKIKSLPSYSIDITSQIERLASLKNKGLLTEEEFAAKKKQLLNI